MENMNGLPPREGDRKNFGYLSYMKGLDMSQKYLMKRGISKLIKLGQGNTI